MRKLLIIPIIVLPFALIILIPRVIKIGKVDCVSQFGPCGGFLEDALGKAKGRNFIDGKSYIEKVLKKDAKILTYSIRFKLPNRFEVNLIERKPIFAVTKEGSGKFSLYDADGVMTNEVVATDLPVVTITGDLEQEKLMFAGSLMADLFNIYSVKSGKIIGEDSLSVTVEQKTAIFPLLGDRDILLGLLKLVLSRLYSMSENSRIKIIDLRFKNPVLR